MQAALRIFALPAKPRFAGLLNSALEILATWRRNSRSRRQLAMLDARALADIGISKAQQQSEVAKRFWRP